MGQVKTINYGRGNTPSELAVLQRVLSGEPTGVRFNLRRIWKSGLKYRKRRPKIPRP